MSEQDSVTIPSWTTVFLTLDATTPGIECRGIEITSSGPHDPQPWRCSIKWPCRVVVDWTARPGVVRRLLMRVVLGARWTRKEATDG